MHRTPSNASHASISRSEAQSGSAAPPAPPAPPPRRAVGSKGEGLDGGTRRRSSQNSLESARSGSLSKPTLPSESEEAVQEQPPQSDILADMTAFQAEIDALRRQQDGNQKGD